MNQSSRLGPQLVIAARVTHRAAVGPRQKERAKCAAREKRAVSPAGLGLRRRRVRTHLDDGQVFLAKLVKRAARAGMNRALQKLARPLTALSRIRRRVLPAAHNGREDNTS